MRAADWYKTATRWTQITLAEDDPEKFDPAFWIDVFRRTHSNAVCISAGGYIAFYPSKVPLHYVSRFLGGRDSFGALVEGARRLNMHVMARVDPHAIHDDAAQAHPEWVALDAAGNPRRHWAFPSVWVTNAYGSYNSEFMPEVVKEIVREYDIDAIFANRWQGHGIDYGEDSRRRFRDFSGHNLPAKSDPQDPAWRAWVAWRRKVLTDVIVQWDDAVRAIRPHASFIPNMGGTSLMEFDVSVIERHCPFLVVDHQGRRGVEAGWAAGRDGKRIRGTFPERPVVLITSIGPEEEYRWKDAVTSGEEIQLWMNDGIAHGLRPWFTKFNGVVPDPRWIAPIADSFSLQETLEPFLEGLQPAAEIAVIDPATTLQHWSRDMRGGADRHELGFYHALVEARIPFVLLSDQSLTQERLSRFRLVILANAACLSDAQCAALRAYVASGGSLVAAHETSLHDADGVRRADFALADVFGARLAAGPRGIVKNTYVARQEGHAITEGFQGAGRIMGGTHLIDIEVTDPAAATPFLYVPDFPDLPMEEVYAREAPRGAALIARETAAGGRVAYIPWNIGEIFWEVLAVDHARLIRNTVLWALGRAPEVETHGQGVVDLALWHGPDATAVALFNLTNPMMMKGPVRDNFPIGAQTVSVAVPAGRRAISAHLAVAGREVAFTTAAGRVVVEIPGVERLELLRVGWG